MTRQLCGSRDRSAICDEKMLQTALCNLRGFPVVAIAERFVESIQALQVLFNWPGVVYEKYQTAPDDQKGPPDSTAAIELGNQYDVRLYKAYAERKSLVQQDVIDKTARPEVAATRPFQPDGCYVISAPSIVKGGQRCATVTRDAWKHLKDELAAQDVVIESHPPDSVTVPT